MKFSLRKMLAGGGLPPFTYYQPVAANNATIATTSAATTSSTKSTSSDSGITDKDLFEMLGKIDGLPSDINAIISSILDLYAFPGITNNSISSLSNRYLSTLQQVKIASFNKKEYDNAYKQAVSNKTLDEYAITDLGKLVVMDLSGKITTISTDTLTKNQNKYLPLTNSNLLKLRADNHPMDNSILSVVLEGVSMSMINKYILDIALLIESSKTSISGETSTSNIAKGIKFIKNNSSEIMSTMGVEGIYQLNEVSESLKALASLALDYIYQTMPSNMKTLLKIKSDNSDKGAKNLISMLINSGLKSNYSFTATLKLDLDGNKVGSKSSKSGSSSSSSSGMSASPITNFVLGIGPKESITLNPGSSYAITTEGIIGVATNGEGKPLGGNATFEDLSRGQYGGNLDFSKATMGGAMILNGLWNRILLNDSKIVSMELPTTINERGILVPDFSILKKLELANESLQHSGIDPEDQSLALTINLVYLKFGLKPKYDTYGNLNTQSYGRFAAILARADESVFGKDPTFEHGTIFEVTDDTLRQAYEETLLGNTATKKYKLNSGIFGIGGDSLYEGTIFIPMSNDINMADAISKASLQFGTKDAEEVAALSNGMTSEEYNKAKQYNNPGNLSQFSE